MNIADAQRVAGVLTSLGGKKINDENKANIVILVTCSVRQKGEERVRGKIRDIRRNNQKAKIGLTGCMIHHGEEKLKKMMPELDFVFRIDDCWKLPEICGLVSSRETAKKPENYFSLAPEIDSPVHAYVPIMNGCNNFCSYCIVPYARGREWSQSAKKIIADAQNLLNAGYPEIFLLGQNVNSYQCPETGMRFSELLRNIDAIKVSGKNKKDEKKWWLRFISPHPKDLSSDLIQCFHDLKHLTPWMHLPIQAGSDRIIQAMNRHYTVEEFAQLVHKLREIRPDIAISTDVIVGFPGETEEDFLKTLDAWKRFEFDFSFISQYSTRPGTAAAKIKDDVSTAEKKKRWTRLNDVQREISTKKLAELVGKEMEVLVEKVGENYVQGRTLQMQNVKLMTGKGHNILEGEFVRGRINKSRHWSASGEVIE